MRDDGQPMRGTGHLERDLEQPVAAGRQGVHEKAGGGCAGAAAHDAHGRRGLSSEIH